MGYISQYGLDHWSLVMTIAKYCHRKDHIATSEWLYYLWWVMSPAHSWVMIRNGWMSIDAKRKSILLYLHLPVIHWRVYTEGRATPSKTWSTCHPDSIQEPHLEIPRPTTWQDFDHCIIITRVVTQKYWDVVIGNNYRGTLDLVCVHALLFWYSL